MRLRQEMNRVDQLGYLNELLANPGATIGQVVTEVFSLDGVPEGDRLAVEENLKGEDASRAMKVAEHGMATGLAENAPGILYASGLLKWAAQTQGDKGVQEYMRAMKKTHTLYSNKNQRRGAISDLSPVVSLLETYSSRKYFEQSSRVRKRLEKLADRGRRSVIAENGVENRGLELTHLLCRVGLMFEPIIEEQDFFNSIFLRGTLALNLTGMINAIKVSDRIYTTFKYIEILKEVGDYQEGKKKIGDFFISGLLGLIDGK